MRFTPARFALVLAATASAVAANPAPPLVTLPRPAVGLLSIGGDVSKPRTWSLSQLQGLGQTQVVETTLKGTPYKVRGVRLWPLLEAAQPKIDAKTKHAEAHFVVLARGRDGYAASFAWPELLPEAGNKSAFVVWEANGKPLDDKEGPFRLVVPGEDKPMRWVHGLATLDIYDGQRLTSKSQ